VSGSYLTYWVSRGRLLAETEATPDAAPDPDLDLDDTALTLDDPGIREALARCRFLEIDRASPTQKARAGCVAPGTIDAVDFAAADMKRIREYNQAELVFLHRGVEELLGRIRQSGYRPASFHSPGSVAAAVMRVFKVKEHKAPDGGLPERVAQAASEAYFGGRFETRMIGRIPGPLYHYDINSAYPAAASRLPCLACGSWIEESDHLVFITWKPRRPYSDPKDRPPFGPFPVRLSAGSLRYPLTNHAGGWYWSQEVAAAAPLTSVKVHRGLRFARGCEHEPFAFLPDLYELRRDLKRRGEPVEYTYKLILNSCYGKLAQRPRSETDQPAYFQPAWAGNITATTRAKLLAAIALDPKAIIQTATDGLTSRRKLRLPISESLGGWSLKEIDLLLVVQSGVYFWRDHSGAAMQRSRGFHPASLTFERCADHLTRNPGRPLELENRRFIGYKTALHRNDLSLWRTWATYTARLETRPEPRREALGRRNGYMLSVPIIAAQASTFDEVAEPFFIADAWETEQPDGPEGDTL